VQLWRFIYTDETSARVGEQRRIKRAYMKPEEIPQEDVKLLQVRDSCGLQLYSAFTYDEKDHIFGKKVAKKKVEALG
jgi:hypothetical protein